MRYQLPAGVSSLMLPNVGSVSAGQILTGDLDRYVTLGLLVVVVADEPAAASKAAPVPKAVVAEITEQLPAVAELVDASGTATVGAEGDGDATAEAADEPHPFQNLPPVRAPEKNKTPNKRR